MAPKPIPDYGIGPLGAFVIVLLTLLIVGVLVYSIWVGG